MVPSLQTKLKSAIQLQDLLDATRMLVPRTRYCTGTKFKIEDAAVLAHEHYLQVMMIFPSISCLIPPHLYLILACNF